MTERKRDGAEQETDDRFPSGTWAGFFAQQGTRVRQRMGLWFAGGAVSGEGRDVVGEFVISGRYDVESGAVWMGKRYTTHRVEYRGWAEGGPDDGIWGTWVIQSAWLSDRGGFHIWPEGHGSASEEHAQVSEPGGVGN